MAHADVYDLVKARLAAAAAPVAVLDFEEVDLTRPQGDDPFIALEDVGGFESLQSVGAPAAACFREFANLSVHVFMPAHMGSTLSDGRRLCDGLRDAMRFQILSPQVRTLTVTSAYPADPFEGSFHHMIMDVEVRREFAAAVA